MADEEEARPDPSANVVPAADDNEEVLSLLDQVPEEVLVKALERRGNEPNAIVASFTEWRAPLPPADMLNEYEQISPGFADRIISLTEREIDHRHGRQKSALGASIGAEKRGQYMALDIALVMIIASASLIAVGQAIAGSIFGGVTLLGLVALFHGHDWRFWRKAAARQPDDEEAD